MLSLGSYRTEYGLCWLDGTNMSVCTEIRRKIEPLRFRLSKSLKVIESNTNRSSTYDFLLFVHSKCGPISYCFRDNRRHLSKDENFFIPSLFNASTEGLLLEFCTGVWGKIS